MNGALEICFKEYAYTVSIFQCTYFDQLFLFSFILHLKDCEVIILSALQLNTCILNLSETERSGCWISSMLLINVQTREKI